MSGKRLALLSLVLVLAGSGLMASCGGGGGGGGGPAVQVGVDWTRVADEDGVLFSSPGESVIVTDVCAGVQGLVAVGYSIPAGSNSKGGTFPCTLEIWTSPDGRGWSRLGQDAFVNGASREMVKEYSREEWSEPRVVSGPAGLLATCGLHVFMSDDGLRWNEVKGVAAFEGSPCEMNSATGRFVYTYAADHFVDVITAAGGYVASVRSDETTAGQIGWLDGPTIWTSPDGKDWSLVRVEYFEIFVMDHVNALAPGGPGLVAVGGAVESDFSANGSNAGVWGGTADELSWTRMSGDGAVLGGPNDQTIWSVSPGGPGLVAVGTDRYYLSGLERKDGVAWASPDGESWSRTAPGEAVMAAAELSAVTSGGSGLVAVGLARFEESVPNQPLIVYTSAGAWTSTDGLAWTRVLLPRADEESRASDSAKEVASFEGGLVVVGSEEANGQPAHGVIWTSLGQ